MARVKNAVTTMASKRPANKAKKALTKGQALLAKRKKRASHAVPDGKRKYKFKPGTRAKMMSKKLRKRNESHFTKCGTKEIIQVAGGTVLPQGCRMTQGTVEAVSDVVQQWFLSTVMGTLAIMQGVHRPGRHATLTTRDVITAFNLVGHNMNLDTYNQIKLFMAAEMTILNRRK